MVRGCNSVIVLHSCSGATELQTCSTVVVVHRCSSAIVLRNWSSAVAVREYCTVVVCLCSSAVVLRRSSGAVVLHRGSSEAMLQKVLHACYKWGTPRMCAKHAHDRHTNNGMDAHGRLTELASAGINPHTISPLLLDLQDTKQQEDNRELQLDIASSWYADDCYSISTGASLVCQAIETLTSEWLGDTGQDVNAKKSLSFSVNDCKLVPVTIKGEAMPPGGIC